MKKHLACFMLSLCFISACDLDFQSTSPDLPQAQETGDTTPALPSIEEAAQMIQIFSAGSAWQVSSRKVNGEAVPLGCHLDDQVIFLASKITFDVGDLRCTLPKDATSQIENNRVGRWQMTDRRSLLVILPDEAPYEIKILAMDEAHLTLEVQEDTYTLVEETYFLVNESTPVSENPDSGFGSAPIILD